MKNLMKIALFFVVSLFFFSCGPKSPEDLLIQKVENEFIKPNMHDPKSYEFVSLTFVDSVVMAQWLLEEVDLIKGHLDLAKTKQNLIKRKIDLISLGVYTAEEVQKEFDEYKIEFQKITENNDKIEAFKQENDINAAQFLIFKLTARGNNALGTKVLMNYYVYVDNDMNFVNITENIDPLSVQTEDYKNFKKTLHRL